MKKYFLILTLIVVLVALIGNTALAAPGRQSDKIVHVVDYGEDLYRIAEWYGTSVEAILWENNLTDPTQIYVGLPLVIPTAAAPAEPSPDPVVRPAPDNPTPPDNPPANTNRTPGCANYHTVRAGETPAGIAQDYGITVDALLRWNGLSQAESIYTGQELCAPLQTTQPAQATGDNAKPDQPAAPSPYYHTVAEGETLLMISLRYNVGYLQIKEANDLANADIILPGQRLLIPGYQPPQLKKVEPAPKPPVVDVEVRAVEPVAPAEQAETPAVEVVETDKTPAAAEPAAEPATDESSMATGQTISELMALPRAKGPLTFKVNDGATWVKDDEVFTEKDPEDTARLAVSTGDETGHIVRVRNGGYEVRGQSEFIIAPIAPVGYEVWIEDPESASKPAFVEVEAAQQNYVNFSKQPNFEPQRFASPDGWVLADWRNPSKLDQRLGGWSNIIVRTPSDGLTVRIESEGGGYQSACATGSKGGGACEFSGLNAAFYTFWIEGTDFKIETYMDGNAYAEFTFAQQPAE